MFGANKLFTLGPLHFSVRVCGTSIFLFLSIPLLWKVFGFVSCILGLPPLGAEGKPANSVGLWHLQGLDAKRVCNFQGLTEALLRGGTEWRAWKSLFFFLGRGFLGGVLHCKSTRNKYLPSNKLVLTKKTCLFLLQKEAFFHQETCCNQPLSVKKNQKVTLTVLDCAGMYIFAGATVGGGTRINW